MELWRTAALGRAGFLRRDGESFGDVVAATHGADTVPADGLGIVDFSAYPEEQLAAGIGSLPDAHLPTGRWLPTSVEVAGVRSLAAPPPWSRASPPLAPPPASAACSTAGDGAYPRHRTTTDLT